MFIVCAVKVCVDVSHARLAAESVAHAPVLGVVAYLWVIDDAEHLVLLFLTELPVLDHKFAQHLPGVGRSPDACLDYGSFIIVPYISLNRLRTTP